MLLNKHSYVLYYYNIVKMSLGKMYCLSLG